MRTQLALFLAVLSLNAFIIHAQDADGGGDSSGGDDGGSGDSTTAIQYAHAIIASLAWVIFFPVGAIMIRLIRSSNAIWVHASIQGFTLLLVTASIGTGIVLAQDTDQLDLYHPIIGLVLFSLVWLQALGGVVHHLMYRKHHRRTVVTHVHLWLGRVLITLGMINGGLGILLSDDASTGERIAYGVVAGVIWLVFVVVSTTAAIKGVRGSSSEPNIAEKPE